MTACDIAPEQFRVAGLDCDRVDLNRELPYPQYSFDVAASIEGIEHLENPFHLLREFRRVLRPDGYLVLTTPNVLSLPSRVRLLTTGAASFFDFDYWLHSSGHITPIMLPQLYTALKLNGFAVEAIAGNRVKLGTRLLSPLAPLVHLCTARAIRDSALRSLLLSREALFCEVIALLAR